ncbi:MAG: hypothetical protein V2I97_05855 [Desulfococcaceae bacterium]|jgi:hypothetical protein|nr:hypothetical protein [Desulfococcaceae bacterium]
MRICVNKEKRIAILSKGPSPDHAGFSFFIILTGLGGLALYCTGDPLADPDIKMAGVFGPIVAFAGALIWLSGYWKFTLRFNRISTFRHGLRFWTLPPERINGAYVSVADTHGRRGQGDMFELSLILRVDHPDDARKKIKNGKCLIFEHTRDEKDETFHYIREQLSDIVTSLNFAKKSKPV